MTQTPHGWTLEAWIAHSEALQAMRDATLALQAKEYERRLEGLNHENARVSAAAEKSVSRELFDARIVPIEGYISLAQGRGAGADSTRAMTAWVVALIASLIAIGTFVFGQRDVPAPVQPQIIYVPAPPGTLMPSPQQQPPGK